MVRKIERQCNLCGKIYMAKCYRLKINMGLWCSRHCAQTASSKPNTKESFWKDVEIKGEDECWVFNGNKTVDGYGSVSIKQKEHKTHRLSYEKKNGPIPKGMVVMHTCDNPPCVNPNHLKLGTQVDNIMDMVKKGRHRNGGKGSESPLSALNSEQRKEVKRRFTGIKGQKSALAIEFGVTVTTICNVLKHAYN